VTQFQHREPGKERAFYKILPEFSHLQLDTDTIHLYSTPVSPADDCGKIGKNEETYAGK